MPLTEPARRLLERFVQAGVLPFDQMGVLQAAASVAAGIALQGPAAPVARVFEVTAPGSAGAVPVRLYRPTAGRRAPLLVFFHGGGFVTGSVATADVGCRALAVATGAVVASVEYRLAPETCHPGPVQDCLAATTFLAARAARWGADPAAVVLAGDSAGGTLAAAVALLARDAGGPPVAGQVLLYPPLAPPRGSDHQSLAQNAEGFGLTRGALDWFWDHYLPDAAAGHDPAAAPLRAADLAGLPPALVVGAQYDPLRDQGLAYVQRLRAAGVPVVSTVYPGMIHGFFSMGRALPQAAQLVTEIAGWLTDLLGTNQHNS